MSLIQRLVPPKLPTVLADHACVDLPGYDIWLHNIDGVHVLPTALDVPKFEEAFSKVLQLYPHAAGQLRCTDKRWFIELTNTAIPVDIDYRLDANCDSLLDGDWVVQDNISSFLSQQPIGANLVNGGAPLLRLKLTFFNNETCIGVSWHHTLGDAITLSRFTHAISQFYQDLPLEYAAPTFKKYDFPAPSRPVKAEFWPLMPHLHDARPFSELGEIFNELYKNVEHLRWRFDTGELAALRSTLSARESNGIYLSKQDCLSAYIVAVLNHNRSLPVQYVMNTSDCRNTCASFVGKHVAGNLIQNVPANVPTDMAGIATTLRHALMQSRDPDYLHNWMSVASDCMLEAANTGKSFLFGSRDDAVNVNSNTVIDWCGAHFGSPDGSRFFTTGVIKHYLRCFKSNPTKGDDGVWRARQSVEVAMGVLAEVKPELLETLARGIPYLLGESGNRPARGISRIIRRIVRRILPAVFHVSNS